MTDKEISDALYRIDMEAMSSNSGCGTPFYIALSVTLVLLFTSCKTQYIPIETIHTEHVHTIDSVRQVDSVFHEKETVIMQVDSEAMMQFGIQIKAAERAWLVRTKELEQKISTLESSKADTVVIHDSIPVVVVKEKELTGFQKFKLDASMWLMGALVAVLIIFFLKIRLFPFHTPATRDERQG